MNNLKAIRKAAGYTQAEVAQKIGLSQPQYSAWENGRSRIDHISLERLAALFRCTVDDLIGSPAMASVRIPVLGSVPAGIPLEAIEDVVGWEDIPASWCSGGREYIALQVKGDSMWPDYLPGDIVIVRKTPAFESGDVCVVYVNGYEATLKQVKLAPEGGITLIPQNQAYPPRTFSPEEIQSLPVSVLGVVVELRRKVSK